MAAFAGIGTSCSIKLTVFLVNYRNVPIETFPKGQKVSLDFYKISFKPTFKQNTDKEITILKRADWHFCKPNKLFFHENVQKVTKVFSLYFDTDLIRNYPLGSAINQYGFFSYNVAEA